MIVKILWKSKTFRAVRYNTNKVEKNKGELLKVSGFGALEGLSEVKPQDYINYLSSIAARNRRVVYPQFHAMISPKGRSLGKEELVTLAERWLKGMGYGDQPYLLIFHKDTRNNHIHMVSSRIDHEGKKISDSYEKIRAYKVLNKLIGKDEEINAESVLSKALQYRFSTHAQFLLILEKHGYAIAPVDGIYKISKFGQQLGSIALSRIDEHISMGNSSQDRRSQLKQIFEKYRPITDSRVYPLKEKLAGGGEGRVLGYSSLLCEKLSSSFGLQFVFHFKNDKPPYGYTILDHSGKNVFKGSEIMSLGKFMETTPSFQLEMLPAEDSEVKTSHCENRFAPDEKMLLSAPADVNAADLISESSEGFSIADLSFGFDISDDIDDEQILGRNRRRQKKARTNTR
ncbi:relaxase/mobilization nuclease domain-containing protein [Pedobacter endophyticus]|uniref:Relaxase/mobilization nuclease domain-containing protein n=1 Tax=Pedobacter endophyticus TaxID=2789740 RepID=A0A7S9L1S5_9SPHI|nr:relaxase/mobilization nuclease domain-containing protein [Pedobacter endophyticus]QPH40541.1 relaxase/mobilization nuclease domain-containing protein [Pedobacter endophyticus]